MGNYNKTYAASRETSHEWEYPGKRMRRQRIIMIAQAKAEKLMFLTHDSLVPYYEEKFIISVYCIRFYIGGHGGKIVRCCD